jgi:hypothetical protein
MSDMTTTRNQIPDHLRQYQKATLGNIDSSDRIIPRIKLIQAISPELLDFPEVAKAGQFWHTVTLESLGPTIKAIPIVIRKSYVLWAPRNDDRGILARAMDAIHWDPADAEFTVHPKGQPKPITYKTMKTVAESGLDQFGTSIPGDSNSPPAASLTYNMMWYLIDFPELSPSIIINTRSSVKPMQQLLSRIDAKPVPHFVQVYNINSVQMKGPEGPYFNYTYTGAGFADEKNAAICSEMYEKFAKGGWVASDETEEELVDKPVFDNSAAGKAMNERAGDDEIPF